MTVSVCSRLARRCLLPVLLLSSALNAQRIKVYEPEKFYDTVNVSFGSFSFDETKCLVTTDATGIFNVASVPSRGGKPTPLTSSESDGCQGIAYFPSDDRILYTSDQGGNELNHLYVREVDGRIVDLTPGERLKAMFLGFAENDRSFFVATNERDPKFFDLYSYEIPAEVPKDGAAPYPRTLVFQNDAGFQPGPISRNGRYLALKKAVSNSDSDLYLVDLEAKDKTPKLLTAHKGDVSFDALTFTPDSRSLLFSSDQESEFKRLFQVDLADGRQRMLLDAGWDVVSALFSRDGRHRIVSINDDAKTRIVITDMRSGEELPLVEEFEGDISRVLFSRSGQFVAVLAGSDTRPTDLFVIDVASKSTASLTRSLPDEIHEENLVPSMLVRYDSKGGIRIPSLLYKPRSASDKKRAPAIVWVHGGPGGQSRVGWRAEIQALCNQGYAVLAINNRGSSGYGKTFFHLDDRRHGEDDLADCLAAKDYLKSLDWVDAGRIAIMGGSYGGYLTVAALTFAPEEFALGIDIFGVTNWVRTLKSIPPWWEAQRQSLYKELGDPSTDEERLHRISPLFHAEKIKRPLLVVQGKNDPRVLKVESDEIVAAVKKNGVPCEYVVFDDEGHGFSKKSNRVAALKAYLDFLAKHLVTR